MRKGDNGMKIFGVIVILVFFGSLFGSVASAGNLGDFYATAYHCFYESEMSGTQTVTKTISGTPYTLKASFLFGGYGVAMQGTGRTGPAGDYIHYTGGGGGFVSVDDPVNDAAVRQRYAQIGITDFTGFGKKGLNYPSDATYSKVSEITGASGRTLIPWYSIAVDPSELSLGTTGTVLFKSGTTPEGATQMSFRADDTGGGITGKHVDIYVAEGQSAIDEWYQTGGNRNVEVHTGDKFNIGDTVRVTNNLNVRTEPGTGYPEITDPDYPSYAPAGTIGIVLSGPSSANSYIWWEVDYGPGSYSGWSVEGGLEKVDDNTPPTVDAFSVTLDDAFTIPYTVSDTGGSGLKQVELWRKGTGSWEQIEVTSLVCEGDGPYSNSFSDAPPSVGTYLYGIRVQDIAGNEGLEPNPPGPIEVEVTPSDVTPPPPPILSSSTHPNENNWYNNNDPLFTWTTPSDASGIAGYRYTIDHFSSTTPDTSVDITGNSKLYTNLADGTWYFHVRAKDNAGNWGSADHYRVKIDTNQPPTAIIDSITPDLAVQGTDTVSFTGHGTDPDGTVVAYNWSSSIDGPLNTSAAFTKPASELSIGTHTIYFKVQDDDGTWSTEDTADLTIYPGPELSYSPESHDFCDMREGETDNITFEIWNSGTDTLTYSLSETCDWLEVHPTNGSSTGEHNGITVDMDTTGLFEGSHTCDITINSNDGSGTFTVMVNVVPCPCGNMGVNPTSWSTTLNCGESDKEIVTVSATGGTVKEVTISKVSGPTWLSVSQTDLGDITSGSNKTFTMTASPPSEASGDFPYTVTVSNTCGSPSSIDVSGTIHVDCPETSGRYKVCNKWTYMVYLDGDNNLEGAAIDDFMEMSSVCSTSDVNIVVQFDRIPGHDTSYGDWEDCKRFHVTYGMTPTAANALENLGECNMGNPNTLDAFVTWAMTEYPAENYALILWNHGSGWKLSVPWMETKGICWDSTSNDHLTLQETGQALSGKYLEVLGNDACLMQMIEVAYQMRTSAGIIVGSEETEPWDGWPYDTILSDLTGTPTMTPSTFGGTIVSRYIEYYPAETLSAMNNGDLPGLATAVDNFAQVLIGKLPGNYNEIEQARTNVQVFYDPDYIDLYHFAELIKSSVPGTESAAQAVMDNVDTVVYANAHGSAYQNAHGLTVYYPKNEWSYWTSYENTDFAINTNWDEFLMKYYEGPSDAVLSLSPQSHNFGDMCEYETDSTTFDVWNSGTGTLTYSLSETCGWVDVHPTSGSSTGEHDTITVDIDTTGLAEEPHTCAISLGSNGGSGTFTVTVNIIAPTGSISVTSSPSGANIYLDGSFIGGQTPYTITNVPAGVHTIGLSLAGYQDWSTNVEVTAGETSYVSKTLTPISTMAPIAVFRNGWWFVSKQDHTGTDWTKSFVWGSPGDKPVVGDIDNNGVVDAVLYRNGWWFVSKEDHTGTDWTKSFVWGGPDDIPVIGDIDNNGIVDAVLYRNGWWFVSKEDHTGTDWTKSFFWGGPDDIPVIGDIDNNGVVDAVLYRNGWWFVSKGDHTGTDWTKSFVWGSAGDKPVIGDIDNNGIVDAVLYRNGWWFVLKGDHTGTDWTKSFVWGSTGDIPVVGDIG